jgi:MYXO-CTERM domain-containing protein
MKLNSLKRCAATIVLATVSLAGHAAYVVGGAGTALTSGSGPWAWDGAYLAGFRAALESSANFGPSAIVKRSISTTTLNAVNAGTLSGIDMYVAPWTSDADAAPLSAAVLSFFLGGGDLFLLQDDSGHDALGTTLGISTTASTGSVSNGGAPLFDGPFGIASNVVQLYAVGQLNESAVLSKNGHIGGRNVQNQVTSAYWRAGEYAPGAGSLFIIADVDMIASTGGASANYATMNANAIYALNTFSFLQSQGGSPDNKVPEPGALLLALSALGAVVMVRRRRQTTR